MAFDNIKANLRILENSNHITTEDLIDSMYLLFKEVRSVNNVDSINDFRVDSLENYGINLLNLLAILEKSYKNEESRLKELADEDINELIAQNNEIIKKLEEIKPRLKNIRDENEKKVKLQTEYKQEIAELAELEKKIESYEEVSVEDVQKEKDILKKKIAELDGLQNQMRDCENELNELGTEILSLEETIGEKAKERDDKESELKELTKLNGEYDLWKKELPNIEAKIKKDFSEAQSAYLFIQNAWNSLIGGGVTYDDSCLLPNGFSSFSDLKKWFKNESMEIEKRIDAFIKTYKALIDHEKEEE